MEEIKFFKQIALYSMVFQHVLSRFFEKVMALITERKEKLCVMAERLSPLGDFVQSFDPLIWKGDISIKDYAIWREHEHGTVNCLSGYLCSEALQPFWEVIKKRRQADTAEYREVVQEVRVNSLQKFLERISYLFEGIEHAKSVNRTDADSFFGYNTGRLPLIDKELTALEELAASIKGE